MHGLKDHHIAQLATVITSAFGEQHQATTTSCCGCL